MCPGSSATLAVEDVFVVDVSVKARVSNHKYIVLVMSRPLGMFPQCF